MFYSYYETIRGCISAAIYYPTNQAGGTGYIEYNVAFEENEVTIIIIETKSYGCDYNTPYFSDEKLKAIEVLFDCKISIVY